jgi:molybdopterin-guanine dinucleotide biosynthesis protein A
MSTPPRLGLVLLTGGKGERLGGPKHDRPHPAGGTWGGHLVAVFRAVAEGPIALVGEALPDHPGLVPLRDPHGGPAVALRTWAASGPPPARRWWVVACDQVDWGADALLRWLEAAEAVDPDGRHWLMGTVENRVQPLGGFLGGHLVAPLAALTATSLKGLAAALPCLDAAGPAATGRDMDTPEDLAAWRDARRTPS